MNVKGIGWEDGVTVIEEDGIESNFIDFGPLREEDSPRITALVNFIEVNCILVFTDVCAREVVSIMVVDAGNLKVLCSELADALMVE